MKTQKVGFGERWRKAQPSKTLFFWSLVGAVALTMIIGFNWGGWTTDAKAQTLAEAAEKVAVTQRLAPICVAQFNMDPDKDLKLTEFMAATGTKRTTYVKDQGWATMPGQEKPDDLVTKECIKLLTEIAGN